MRHCDLQSNTQINKPYQMYMHILDATVALSQYLFICVCAYIETHTYVPDTIITPMPPHSLKICPNIKPIKKYFINAKKTNNPIS